MKKKTCFNFIFIIFICFLAFPKVIKADHPVSGLDECIFNRTCFTVCEWNNLAYSSNNTNYHAYLYYVTEDNSWKYVWYYPYNPFKASQSGTNLPTKNIIYEKNSKIQSDLLNKGICPPSAYVDLAGIAGEPELCLDTGKILETKNGVTKSYCVKEASGGFLGLTKDFKGTSSLIYDYSSQLEIYFDEHAVPALASTTCASLADSTGYAVDDSKVQPLLDQFSTDFTRNFLNGKPIPSWMKNGTYKDLFKSYQNRLQLKVRACNVELREKAKADLAAGKISQKELDQSIENASKAEQGVQERAEQLDQNITSGVSPADPSDPNNPNVGPSEATCNSILGAETQKFLKEIFTYIQIAGVVLAVILGMAEFMGATVSGEADANKKATKHLIVRVAMVGALLLVPALLNLIFSTFGVAENTICIL